MPGVHSDEADTVARQKVDTGHCVGAETPALQKLPAGQAFCVAELEPARQK